MRLPPLLTAGARVALVAPAGPLRGPEELDASIANARSLGWEPIPGPNVLGHSDYLGGTDAERLQDLNAALADDHVDAIWCVRGGYGSMRILPHVDWTSLSRRPRALIGFSDVTALHAAANTRCDLVTYHAPTARGRLTDFSRTSLVRAVMERHDDAVAQFRAGKSATFGFLVGQVMKQSAGKANPKLVNQLLRRELEKV